MKQRFEHLVKVLSSKRFLKMKGLNNEVPFLRFEFALQATLFEGHAPDAVFNDDDGTIGWNLHR